MITKSKDSKKSSHITLKNYQLDTLKFIFTLLVLISHTNILIGENTKSITKDYIGYLGWVSVHFFFIVSGLLMGSVEKRQ